MKTDDVDALELHALRLDVLAAATARRADERRATGRWPSDTADLIRQGRYSIRMMRHLTDIEQTRQRVREHFV